MIHVEKLLGMFLNTALASGRSAGRSQRQSGGGFFGASKGAVGMGIIGVAMAAFDHFSKGGSPGSPVGGAPTFPPPPPTAGSMPLRTPPPPPPASSPGPRDGRLPPPLPAQPGAPPASLSLLLLRAMIAAASADGVIDAEERRRILERSASAGISPEERAFLERELGAPAGLEQIASGAKSAGFPADVYTVSLLAVDVDTPSEVDYLWRLAGSLGLDASTIAKCHEQVGAPPLA